MKLSRKTLLTGTALAVAAIGTMIAAPMSASADSPTGGIFCPPQITKIGGAVDAELLDGEAGSGFTAAITSGALPDGLVLTEFDGLPPRITGTASRLGSYRFHMQFTDNVGHSEGKDCTMDIVPSSSVVERITGDNRYEVAASIGRAVSLGGTAPLVYVASGENFADALSASAVAAQHNAPLILSSATDVPNVSLAAIYTFEPANIVIVGGEKALSPVVAAQLASVPGATVTRISGANRFAVSRALISHPTFGAKASATIAVATGQNFPDALSAAPVAGKIAAPVLLVDGKAGALSADEKAFLTSRGLTSATLYGGTDVLSAGIATDLTAIAGSVSRVDGFDRFAVSANTVAANYTGPIDTVYIATGANFPDALAGGTLAGITKSPILLSRKSCMTTEVAAQVRALSPKHIVLLGGPAVLDANLGTLPLCA